MKKLIAAISLLLVPAWAVASVTVSVNGSNYTIPQKNEKGWGDNVTSWIQAISANTLQPSGGTFTLSADLDFGSSFGVKSTYYKSRSTNIASSGQWRLSNTDSISFRNASNSGDLSLTPGASDGILNFNSVPLVTTTATQTLTNKTLSAPVITNGAATITLPSASGTLTTMTPTQYGVVVSGSAQNLGVITPDASTSKVLISGGSSANPSWGLVAAGNVSSGAAGSGSVLTADGAGAASWAAAGSSPDQHYEISGLGLSASVSSNALTVAVKQKDGSTNASGAAPVKVGFRNGTSATGGYNQRSVTGSLSITVPSTATLGQASGLAENLWAYLLDDAGTVDICLSGRVMFDEGSTQSSTQISSGATSGSTLYCASAHTGAKPIRLVGRLAVTETTAGTWASAPSEISQNFSKDPMSYSVSAVYSSSSTSITNSGDTVIVFPTKRKDTHNAYNTSTGVYTVPISGQYLVSFQIQTGSVAWTAGSVIRGRYRVNSTIQITTLTYTAGYTGNAAGYGPPIPLIVSAGDTIDFMAFQNGTTSTSLSGDTATYLSIYRVGN